MIKNLRLKCMLLATALTVTLGINAQNVQLVKDMNPFTDANPAGGNSGFTSGNFTVLNGLAYFAANDGIHGTELWSSDGTQAGTKLVKDINPGFASSTIRNVTLFKGKLFFMVANKKSPQQLWVSDGTNTGTQLVKEVSPVENEFHIPKPVVVDSLLYFITANDFFANKLWKSNGTPEGTTLVADLYTPAFGNGYNAGNLTACNGLLYFSMLNNDGTQLWRSNGTAAGTTVVKNISSKQLNGAVTNLTPLNGLLYFNANDGQTNKLWVSNGTPDSTLSFWGDANIQPSYGLSDFPFAVIKHSLFFLVDNLNNYHFELYKYNTDSANGAQFVHDIISGKSFNELPLVTVKDSLLFFNAYQSGNYHEQLWVTTGSDSTCTLLKTYPFSVYSNLDNMSATGDNIFFESYDDSTGYEPWVSNGTVAGTHIVKDIATGLYSSVPSVFTHLDSGKVLFSAADGINGFELWRTDSGYTTATMVKDINKTTTATGGPNFYITASYAPINNNGLLFNGYDFTHGSELWKTDGTANGTNLVKDVLPGYNAGYSTFSTLHKLNGMFYYFASSLTDTIALWKTDGTQNGTVPVDTFKAKTLNYFQTITSGRTVAYFFLSNDDQPFNTELWVTDGISKARLLKNKINYQPTTVMVAKGDTAYFINQDENGAELWMSDGTAAGTRMVKDINPGTGNSNPANLTVYNNKLYFNADDGSGNNYLWVTDGSADGTQLVKKVNVGIVPYTPTSFTLCGDKFYFSGDDGTTGYELWTSDGTEAGTTLVKDINPGSGTSNIADMTNVSGSLYFTADDGVHGKELWKSSNSFTYMVKDISAGTASSNPLFLVDGNGLLYFVLNDTVWQSNGIPSGTHAITDAGLNGLSNFGNLVPSGDRLYFGAYSYQYGYELYVMGANSTLPVTMLSFTGQWAKNDAQLNWVTANELNSSHFNIQRSLNGTAFTTIGQVKAQGTTSSTYRYNYTDANAASLPASSLYYRLQQVDLDGNATYSNLVRLPLASNNTITIAPNPAHKAAYIISSTTITGAAVTIADMAGHTVYSGILNLQAGAQVPLNIAGIPAGVYNVTIQNGIAIKQQSKLVVQ
jgi:ELWxxDGT repeat protein